MIPLTEEAVEPFVSLERVLLEVEKELDVIKVLRGDCSLYRAQNHHQSRGSVGALSP